MQNVAQAPLLCKAIVPQNLPPFHVPLVHVRACGSKQGSEQGFRKDVMMARGPLPEGPWEAPLVTNERLARLASVSASRTAVAIVQKQ